LERQALLEDFQSQLQHRHGRLHAEIAEAFRSSVAATDGQKRPQASVPKEEKLTTEVPCRGPRTPTQSPHGLIVEVPASPPSVMPSPDPVARSPDKQERPRSGMTPVKQQASVTAPKGGIAKVAPQEAASQQAIEWLFGGVLIAFAITVLVDAQIKGSRQGRDLEIRHFDHTHDFSSVKSIINVLYFVFESFFTFELLWHLQHEKLGFWRSPWIWLDLVIIPLGWLHRLEVLELGIPPQVLRIVRVARLGKLLRTMSSCSKLQLLVRSMKASMRTLLWSFLVLTFAQVIAGTLLNQMLSDLYEDASIPVGDRKEIFNLFGTTSRTMITMFQVVFANWASPCWLLVNSVSEWYGIFIIAYRCVFGFALTHIIASLFLAETHKICAADKEMEVMERMRDGDLHKQKLREFFISVERADNGRLSRQDLEVLVDHPDMRRHAEKLGIHPLLLFELFDSLSARGPDGHVDLEEFIHGVLRVDGFARAIDAYQISITLEKLNRKIGKIEHTAEIPFNSLDI